MTSSPFTAELPREIVALFRVGLPVIFTNFTLTVMQITDAWMIGELGSEELAAVTPPGLLIFMLVSFGYSFLSAIATFVAQAFGRGQPHRCGMFAWQGIVLAVAMGIGALFFYPAAAWFFRLFGNESIRVLELEVLYFQVSLLSIAPGLVIIAISNFFIGIQKTRVAMVSSAIGVTANVFLNYGLIFGRFGFPELGFAGAAWGTVFAASIEVIVLFGFFLSPNCARLFATRRPLISRPDLLRIARIGLPAGFQGGIDVVSWGIILSWLVAFFGTAHQAATTVLLRFMHLSFLPAEGIAVASLTLIGSAVGAGQPELADARARLGFRVIGVYMTAMGLLFFLFRGPLMRLFSDDPAVIAIGVSAMGFVSLFQFFDAMNIAYVHSLRAVGDNLWPSVVNVLLCVTVLLGGGLAIVYYFPQWQSSGIWALAGFYILSQGLAFRYRWTSGAWKRINLFAGEN